MREGIVNGAGNAANGLGEVHGPEREGVGDANGRVDVGFTTGGGANSEMVKSAESGNGRNVEEGKARRRVLSLYRWTSGSRGLSL